MPELDKQHIDQALAIFTSAFPSYSMRSEASCGFVKAGKGQLLEAVVRQVLVVWPSDVGCLPRTLWAMNSGSLGPI